MSRKFKTANYEETLNQTIRLAEALPPQHLARFVVDIIAQLALSKVYERYAPVGGEAIAPEILLELLFYGYATGLFSSRKIEKASYESIPFRYIAGGLHPDHDTIANFRKTFLEEIQELFVQFLLLAQAAGVLKLGNISLDGSKVHADASKSKAVSYKRLIEIDTRLRREVAELFELGEQVDQGEKQLPEGMVIQDEIAIREERLANLAQAKAVLEARAKERYEAEQAEYEAKMREREKRARKHHRKPKGRPPQPPEPGPQDKDQYNFTDPDSRIMKNSNNKGVDQHYNVQVAADQECLLIVANGLSNHPNDKQEAVPTLDAIAPNWVNRRQLLWTMATSVKPTSAPSRSEKWKPTSPLGVSRTIKIGTPSSPTCPSRRAKKPAPKKRWLTSCKPRWAKPSIVCANAPLNL
jgi:transposase